MYMYFMFIRDIDVSSLVLQMADMAQAHDTLVKQKEKEHCDDVTRLKQEHEAHIQGESWCIVVQ